MDGDLRGDDDRSERIRNSSNNDSGTPVLNDMETKAMEDIHKRLIKQYHTLCGLLGLSDGAKAVILEDYGVESSKDLSQHDLIDLCASLSEELERRKGCDPAEMDKLRKRLLAVIGRFLEATGDCKKDLNYIKSVACRAAEAENFNKIPKDRLRSLYAAFNTRLSDLEKVANMKNNNDNIKYN